MKTRIFARLAVFFFVQIIPINSSSAQNSSSFTPFRPPNFSHGCGTGCRVDVTFTGDISLVKTSDNRRIRMANIRQKFTYTPIPSSRFSNHSSDRYVFAECNAKKVALGDTPDPPPATSNLWRRLFGDSRDYTTVFLDIGDYFDAMCHGQLKRANKSQSLKNIQNGLTENSKMAINGIGPITVGMTVAEAEKAGKVRLIRHYGNASCAVYIPQGGPKDLRFIVTDGRIASVETANPLIQTISGANVGDTVNEVLEMYPERIQVTPSGTIPNGQDLIFVPRDEADLNYRLYFISRNSKVIRIRAGRLPAVSWYEGCL